MTLITRLATVTAAVALGALVLVPSAQAAKPGTPVFTMGDPSAYEYHKDCLVQGPPYDCPTTAVSMYARIWTPSAVREQVIFGYVIEPITATQGVDYTGTTGTAVMAANTNWANIVIPVAMDGLEEPSETLRVRLTSSSIGGDFSDIAIGTILNDGQIPPDCTLTRPSQLVTTMECANRPPTQSWRFQVTCYDSGGWGYVRVYSQTITGNGTAVAECEFVNYAYGELHFYLVP